MPWRSVEDVALHRRPFPRFALPIEETDESGAAARECHVAQNGCRPAATDSDARRSRMRFLCLKLIWVLGFVRPSNDPR